MDAGLPGDPKVELTNPTSVIFKGSGASRDPCEYGEMVGPVWRKGW